MAPASKELESGSPTQTRTQTQTQEAQVGVASPSSETDLAQAYRELTRGEQTATALEANLSSLERKLDEMLAAFEAAEADVVGSGGDPTTKEQTNGQPDHGEKKA